MVRQLDKRTGRLSSEDLVGLSVEDLLLMVVSWVPSNMAILVAMDLDLDYVGAGAIDRRGKSERGS